MSSDHGGSARVACTATAEAVSVAADCACTGACATREGVAVMPVRSTVVAVGRGGITADAVAARRLGRVGVAPVEAGGGGAGRVGSPDLGGSALRR